MKNAKKKKQKYSPRGRRADSQSLQTLQDLLGILPLQRDYLVSPEKESKEPFRFQSHYKDESRVF